MSVHPAGKNRANPNNFSKRNIKKLYDNFNSNLVDMRATGSGADKKFYGKLKEAGYGAIQDVNDMKFSGYHAKNPLIVFDNAKKNITVQSVKELTDNSKLLKGALVELGKGQVEGMAKTMASPYTAAAVAGTAGAMVISDYNKPNNTQPRR